MSDGGVDTYALQGPDVLRRPEASAFVDLAPVLWSQGCVAYYTLHSGARKDTNSSYLFLTFLSVQASVFVDPARLPHQLADLAARPPRPASGSGFRAYGFIWGLGLQGFRAYWVYGGLGL